MSLIELQTKLDYEPTVKPAKNVLDFERLAVRYWNNSKLTDRQERLFKKLNIWHNIWIARSKGYTWCLMCEDTGYLLRDNGQKGLCICAVNPEYRDEIG